MASLRQSAPARPRRGVVEWCDPSPRIPCFTRRSSRPATARKTCSLHVSSPLCLCLCLAHTLHSREATCLPPPLRRWRVTRQSPYMVGAHADHLNLQPRSYGALSDHGHARTNELARANTSTAERRRFLRDLSKNSRGTAALPSLRDEVANASSLLLRRPARKGAGGSSDSPPTVIDLVQTRRFSGWPQVGCPGGCW